MIHSLFSSDYDLHQAVIKTFHAYNRVSETFEDDYTNSTGGPRTAAQNGLEVSAYVPRLTTVYSTSHQCLCQLARPARQRTHILRSNVGLAYVTGLSD
ncbi:unnamed protein product [Heligmosomoides polygyrus]|uniref:Uncharacterized protein n=1 Tax=Heligmosomoides polygyrus TaxID=6339 RepID=A0A183GJ78_HELPZ|nr:unnamed protein product [Heligmosomoides polygyrus]